jgi:hypothetical protein
MTEYRIKWQACPHIHHPSRILFVMAPDAATAKAVAKDYIERQYAVGWFTIWSVEPYVRPTGGHVVSENAGPEELQ